MDLRFVRPDLARLEETSAEVVVCAAYEDVRPFRGILSLLDWRMAGRLHALARRGFLKGEAGELVCVPPRPRLPFDKLLVCGLGARARFDDDAFRASMSRLVHALEGLHVRRAVVELPGRGDDAIAPERVAELLFGDPATSAPPDGWWLVEGPAGEERLAAHAREQQRSARRAM